MSENYFFRVKASDRGELRRVLRAINVLDRDGDGNNIPNRLGDCWVEVGRLPDWTDPSKFIKDPDSGESYWHYNLRTTINVKKRIKDLVAEGDPDALILDSAKGRWWAKVSGDDMNTPTILKSVWL